VTGIGIEGCAAYRAAWRGPTHLAADVAQGR
jgi:hypothetical protein